MSHVPIVGELVSGPKALALLKKDLRGLRGENIVLISAYIKLPALEELAEVIGSDNMVRVLARWAPQDLVGGSSDLGCFRMCRESGWSFSIRQDLHAKVYGAGKASIFVGSANLTASGFSIGIFGNEEAIVKANVSDTNTRFIEGLLESGTQLTDDLFHAIQLWTEIQQNTPEHKQSTQNQWPAEIRKYLKVPPASREFWVSECFWTDGSWLVSANAANVSLESDQAIRHDISLLGFQSLAQMRSVADDRIAEAVTRTTVFGWLVFQLEHLPDRELYFGGATAKLHDALIDDPRPYRREVKVLLGNLLAWIEATKVSSVSIDIPYKHSQRIRLLRSS